MAFKVNPDKVQAAKQQADAKQASFKGDAPSIKWFRLTGDSAKLRIMPPFTDQSPYDGVFWRIVAQHWNVNEEQKAPILCPKETPYIDSDECPICDFVDYLKSTGEVQDKELAGDIRAKQSYLFNVVDCMDPVYTAKDVSEYKKSFPDRDVPFSAGDVKLQVYAAPFTVWQNIVNIFHSGGDIVDLTHGHNITISRNGKGINTKYVITPELKPTKSNVSEDHDLVDLSKVGQVKEVEELRKILSEGIGAEYPQVMQLGSGSSKATKALKSETSVSKTAAAEDDDEDEDLSLGEDSSLEDDMLAALGD